MLRNFQATRRQNKCYNKYKTIQKKHRKFEILNFK